MKECLKKALLCGLIWVPVSMPMQHESGSVALVVPGVFAKELLWQKLSIRTSFLPKDQGLRDLFFSARGYVVMAEWRQAATVFVRGARLLLSQERLRPAALFFEFAAECFENANDLAQADIALSEALGNVQCANNCPGGNDKRWQERLSAELTRLRQKIKKGAALNFLDPNIA